MRLLAANVLAWFAFQFGVGYLVARIDAERIDALSPLFRPRAWERGGRIYQAVRVRCWKGLLPSGGRVFGTFSIGRVESAGDAYLQRWMVESRRAELSHWLALLPLPLFLLWNPPAGWAINLVYALSANLPCIVSQRYNRPRVQALRDRRLRRVSGWRAAT